MKNFFYVIIGITIVNIILRILFSYYGYIGNDEGIAFNNAKLAYSGLIPFIDYNGWDSLLNDYIMGLPHLFFSPTIHTQRLYAISLSLIVLIMTLLMSKKLGGHMMVLFTSLFLLLGSPLYLYYSSIPYSTQTLTFFITLSLFLISNTIRNTEAKISDCAALTISFCTIAIRSQALPFSLLIWLYVIHKYRKKKGKFLVVSTCLALATSFFLFLPFLQKSLYHTIYALIWPFFTNKIFLYTQNTQNWSFPTLLSFILTMIKDYGIYFIVIVSSLIVFLKTKKKINKEINVFMYLCCSIVVVYVMTGIIHQPSDSSYIYPSVPFLSLVSSYYLSRIISLNHSKASRNFIVSIIFFILCANFAIYPHYKFIKTSRKSLNMTPHDSLNSISNQIKEITPSNAEVFSLYLPLQAAIDRKSPVNMNEGPGSISILDDEMSNKIHMTSIPMLRAYIASRKAQLIIFPDSFIFYFGKNQDERDKTLNTIKTYYHLVREYPEFNQIDGSKSKALYIYQLSK